MSKVQIVVNKLTANINSNIKLTTELNRVILRKAQLVAVGRKTLEDATKEITKYLPDVIKLSKQRVWVDSRDAIKIGVEVAGGCSDSLSLGGSWFTRTVTNIKDGDYGLTGTVKLNHKIINVEFDVDNEWKIA